MTIDNVTRLPGTAGATYGQGSKYDPVFEVFFSGAFSESQLLANSDARLPKIGQFLGQEAGATSLDLTVYCSSVKVGLKPNSLYCADTQKAGGIAEYLVNYTQVTPQFAIDPVARTDVQWGGSDITEVSKYDAKGKALVNSAKQLYAGLPGRPIRAANCNIMMRQTANPAAVVTLFSNTTNSTTIWGVAVGNGLIGKITSRKMQEGFSQFWELNFPIQFRRDSWKLKMLDNGYVFLDDDGNPQTVTDHVGNAKPTPVLLDGSGGVLAPSADPVYFPTDGFDMSEATDWTTLTGLPNPFAF